MGSTQLIDFTPADIDMIFAVSQENLNEGLSEYINGLGSQMSWAFDVDSNGNLFPPADQSAPDISFSGTLAAPMETASGPRTWIVDLSQSGVANQVTFNLTFADGATFNDNQLGRKFTQSMATGGPQWVIPFQVDLTTAKIDELKNIPQWLRDRFAALNGDYGEVFDLSQVLLDLTTLAFKTSYVPPGIDLYDWELIVQGAFACLQANHGDIYTTPPSAGYAITYNGATPTQTPPTYTPTSVDFVILPNTALPGASALVFVFMINQRPFPTSPANAFVDVVLITHPDITPGVALVGAPNFVSFLQDDVQDVGLDTGVVNNYVESVQVPGGVSWQLSQDAPVTVSTSWPSSDNSYTILDVNMSQQNSNAQYQAFAGPFYNNSSTTNNFANASLSSFQADTGFTQLTIVGSLTWTISYTLSPLEGLPSAWSSPSFQYSWSTSYKIQSLNATDAQSGGGVQFALSASMYPTSPTTTGTGENFGTVPPTTQDYVSSILAPVVKALPSRFKSNIASLSSMGRFVFPGGGTFTFRDPAVNNVYALYTTIRYQNPN
ncbi:hypothetical protein NOF04DRAFT_11452 [Fusarium oxysporum II5]|uniref:Uncharacterized protein n=1 Tax=Fusarium odoratissimum (strain NRRL 54006) TaxID=1089451 RepID=X0J009_FUSO5|nr:uncharacterized protein FOIG_12681 [Fusarium odoratissimum NRRL 54006]EXL94487.1 hypothetical protein FOIG_12681 [Fusarium odoratissimum NRRL 54006]KAK2122443.1 hypothetical protein NOF04DRAFT_11452 [Fusarium oxysporum II5]